MSDNNQVGVEFGGQVAPSYDSSVEHVKRGLKEAAAEYGHFAKAVGEHLAVTAVAHTAFEHRASLTSAVLSVVRVAATRALSAVAPAAAGAIGAFSLVYGSVKILSGALFVLEKASEVAAVGLGKFSFLEDLTGRLRSFTGSAEAARQKLGELTKTFQGTPVAVPDAVDAFKSARVADSGSGELSSGKGLRLLGDVAVGSGNGIKETTDAVGKLYVDLQSGQPIKEAADKLREMGVISGDTRGMLDRLLASGKGGAEVWSALRVEFEKSTGAMKSQEQTLSSLQKGLQEAKDRLYTSFAEGSVPFEKDKLSAKTAILQKVQPVAQEAGDVYGAMKTSVSDLAKKLLELVGVKAASDKALSSGSALKTITDGYIVARVALLAFGVAAIPALAGAIYSASALSLAVVGMAAAIAGVVGVAAAGATGLYIYTTHLNKANEAHLALMRGTDDLVAGLRKQRSEMTTVTDLAVNLAKAYDLLKNAQEGYASAKGTKAKEEFLFRMQSIQSTIKSFENVDRSTLKSSEAGQKSEAGLKDAKDKGDELIQSPTEKYNAAKSTLDEAKKKRDKLQAKLDKAQAPTNDDAEIERLQGTLHESRERTRNKQHQGTIEEIEHNQPDTRQEYLAREAEIQKDAEEKIAALRNKKAGRQQTVNAASDAVRAQDVVVQNADNDTAKAGREKEAYEAKLAELAAEKQIAGLRSEGLTRTREEWALRKAGLEAERATADKGGNKTRVAEIDTKLAQGDASARKEERAFADAEREVEAERKIAGLTGEAVDKLREERNIRSELIVARLREAEAAHDTLSADKARAAYFKEQVDSARKIYEATKGTQDEIRSVQNARKNRKDAADKRDLDHAFKDGKITDEQHRTGQAALIERQRQRFEAEAVQKEKEAETVRATDPSKARGLLRDAANLHAQADAKKEEEDDVLHPEQRRRTPIADELRKIGGGGNAYGSEISDKRVDATRKVDETNKRLENIEKLLQEGNKIDRKNRVL